MSDRQRFLLSPYRLPGNHAVYLNEDEMAAWLSGYMALWHPALLYGAAKPPRIDSAYDHDSPVAGRLYVMPEAPPQFMADDWPDRVRDSGAIKVGSANDRAGCLQAIREAIRESASTDAGREHFSDPAFEALFDLPIEMVRPFYALGFGYLMIDSLYDAMDHEKLLDVDGFWADVQTALGTLLKQDAPAEQRAPASGEQGSSAHADQGMASSTSQGEAPSAQEDAVATVERGEAPSADGDAEAVADPNADPAEARRSVREEALRSAAAKLLAGREVLYSVNIHLIDLWILDSQSWDADPPAALAGGSPLNVMLSGSTVEQMVESRPERIELLRKYLNEEIQPPVLEVIGGAYRDREDALMPPASQLWNMRTGRTVIRKHLGVNVEVHARQRSAYHPDYPAWVQASGYRRALLTAFDGAVTPGYRATVVNWSSPDGKSIDAFTRMPSPAHKAETFFNLVYTLHQSISNDSAPTLAIRHGAEPAHEMYHDWLALARLTPALGEFTTFSRYFSDALAGEYVGTANADDFFADDLEERVNAHRRDPVSGFAVHARRRRKLDAAWTAVALHRSLTAGPIADDTAALWRDIDSAETVVESTAPAEVTGSPGADLSVEDRALELLARRLQSGSTENQPGWLFVNPCGFTRRMAVELEGIAGPLPVDGPVKAAQFDADKARMVIEVPPLGFAWIPKNGPSGTARPKPRIRAVEGTIVRNEFLEAEIDPQTGGLRSVRDVRLKSPRLAMQVVFNPGSRAESRGVEVVHNGSALGEIVTQGVLFSEQNEELATYRIRYRAWLTRPMLEIRFELEPKHLPTGYPWHAYYGLRFAGRDERIVIRRGVNGVAQRTNHTRPVSGDFVESVLGRSVTTVLTGGLPFHQKHGERMVDVILVPEGETARTFDLGIALDRDHPMSVGQGMVTPVSLVPTTKGPPRIGPSGWLFQIDSPNLLLLGMRPIEESRASVVLTLQETSAVHGGSAALRCVRDPVNACMLDGDDQPTTGLVVEGDSVRIDFAGGELLRVRIDFE